MCDFKFLSKIHCKEWLIIKGSGRELRQRSSMKLAGILDRTGNQSRTFSKMAPIFKLHLRALYSENDL